MKRIMISLALTAIVLAASVFEVIYVGKKSDDYTDRINKIDAMLSNNDTEKKGLASIKGSEYPFIENIL